MRLRFLMFQQRRYITTHRFADIFAHIRKPTETLLLTDLDHTVFGQSGIDPERKLGFGGDYWISRILSLIPPDDTASIHRALAYYFFLQKHTNPMLHSFLIEENLSDIFSQLRESGVSIVGVTARSWRIDKATLQILHRHKLGFSASRHAVNLGILAGEANPVIENGDVIFCAGEKKSLCIEAFWKTVKGAQYLQKAKTILFIDDGVRHCEEVESHFKKLQQGSQTLFYRASDRLPRATPEEMDRQSRLMPYPTTETALRHPTAETVGSSNALK